MNLINILLVEDNEGDIVLTVEAMKEFKYPNRLSIAKNGSDAIEMIENQSQLPNWHEPDLILLDVNLPKINGHEVLKKIKNNDAKKHIPIVMLTTSSSQIDVLKSYQNYANCYITKPVDASDFGRVINSIETFWFSTVQLPKKL